MVSHKIYIKGELSDKFVFLDSIKQTGTLKEIYDFYQNTIKKTNEYKSFKIIYKPEFELLQVIMKDFDNSIWKHVFKNQKDSSIAY